MKTTTLTAIAVSAFLLFFKPAYASAENTFHAVGKIIEDPNKHTTKHEHELRFVRLDDGDVFDIVESPDLIKAHCEAEKNSVIEIEGYRTGKFLFWGGNLVITNFKIHEDIEVPKLAHVTPESVRGMAKQGHDSKL